MANINHITIKTNSAIALLVLSIQAYTALRPISNE